MEANKQHIEFDELFALYHNELDFRKTHQYRTHIANCEECQSIYDAIEAFDTEELQQPDLEKVEEQESEKLYEIAEQETESLKSNIFIGKLMFHLYSNLSKYAASITLLILSSVFLLWSETGIFYNKKNDVSVRAINGNEKYIFDGVNDDILIPISLPNEAFSTCKQDSTTRISYDIAPVIDDLTTSNSTCGAAIITVSVGDGTYVYLWDDALPQTVATASETKFNRHKNTANQSSPIGLVDVVQKADNKKTLKNYDANFIGIISKIDYSENITNSQLEKHSLSFSIEKENSLYAAVNTIKLNENSENTFNKTKLDFGFEYRFLNQMRDKSNFGLGLVYEIGINLTYHGPLSSIFIEREFTLLPKINKPHDYYSHQYYKAMLNQLKPELNLDKYNIQNAITYNYLEMHRNRTDNSQAKTTTHDLNNNNIIVVDNQKINKNNLQIITNKEDSNSPIKFIDTTWRVLPIGLGYSAINCSGIYIPSSSSSFNDVQADSLSSIVGDNFADEFNWINLSSDYLRVVWHNKQEDSLALVTLYNSTDGSNWVHSWDLSLPIDTWAGVILDDDGYVVGLDLAGQELRGELPIELANLNKLEYLNLAYNELNGEIPNFDGLENLRELYLSFNQLNGEIPDFSDLSNLMILDIDDNQLRGTIPDFSNLPNLKRLSLHSNELSDSIPDFSNLANLTGLNLSGNALSGEIPNFENLLNLQELYLHSNNLNGDIPFELSNLKELSWLRLDDNNLTGNVPPEIGELNNLEYLTLNNNKLVGNIPKELESLNKLKHLDLSHNRFSGAIPVALSSIGYLDIAFNQFVENEIAEIKTYDGLRGRNDSLYLYLPPELSFRLKNKEKKDGILLPKNDE